MNVINEIIEQSALGVFSNALKAFVLATFIGIMTTLMVMFVFLLKYGPHISIQYGY